MSEPVHIGQLIAAVFREIEQRVKGGEVRAHPRCICNPYSRLIQPYPGVYLAEWGHDDWCPVVGGKGKAA